MTPARSLPPAGAADLAFAREMLPLVSRTFTPAIDALPGDLSGPVRLAYLLCRIADTIEDAPGVPAARRRTWLLRFGSLLAREEQGEDRAVRFAQEIAGSLPGPSSERRLAEGAPRLLRILRATESARRASIERWTGELAVGMARFVQLEEESSSQWTALATCEDLDAYEYYVAGTVGCLLDDLIAPGPAGMDRVARESRRRHAVAFGQGLQGTNILQDLSVDRARGWCYLPEDVARRHGTSTSRLHEPGQRDAAMAAVRELAARAARHLDSGLEFVLLLPRPGARVRLFCLWPLLLALRTLTRLSADALVLDRRVRISRAEVDHLTRDAIRSCSSNAALRRLYDRERADLTSALALDPAFDADARPRAFRTNS